MAKAIIYARVSTTRQADDGLPVESQIEHGYRKAESLEADVLRVFTDAGISGRTDERPAFRDAVRYCKAHGVQYFICWSTSRFARNKLDAALYKRELEKTGTRVIYVSVDLDNRTDSGWMMESILEIFDEHYSRQVSADTLRSMIKNARDGHFNGGRVPLGFTVVADGKRKRLAVDEVEAALVRDIFGLYLSGDGAKSIATRLNDECRLNRGRRWSKGTVLNLLKNMIYTGHTVFNRANNATKAERPREEWIITKSHQPIIDEDTFMDAQILIGGRAPSDGGGSPHSGFTFTGLLKCGACGASMQIESAKGRNRYYHYYNCSASQKGIGCVTRRISAEDLDDFLTEAVLDKVLSRDAITSMINDLHELTGNWIKDRAARRAATVKDLRDTEKKLRNLYDILELHGKEAPNLGDLTIRMRELKAQRDQMEEKLVRLEEEEMPSVDVSDLEITEMTDLMRDIVRTTADKKRLRAFFSSFINEVVVHGDGAVIYYDRAKVMTRSGLDAVRSKAKSGSQRIQGLAAMQGFLFLSHSHPIHSEVCNGNNTQASFRKVECPDKTARASCYFQILPNKI